jgi:hypothetical protein
MVTDRAERIATKSHAVPCAMRRRRRQKRGLTGFLANHSLTLVVAGFVTLWLALYRNADQSTHVGAFFGNSIADWLGTLAFVVLTKYCFEIGSSESNTPPPDALHGRVLRFLSQHSLTLAVIVSGAGWVWLFARTDADSKSGQVYGNIVSEWGQLLALIVMTKYFRETGSKDD